MSYYYAGMAYMAGHPIPTPTPIYGPPSPPIIPAPVFYLQCGMCGQSVLGAGWIVNENRPGAPTPATGEHQCPGPFPVDMGGVECIGPFFDFAAPIGLTKVCCICLRMCEPDDPDSVKATHVGDTYMPYMMNDHQLEWHHT